MSTLRRSLGYLNRYPRLWLGALAALILFTAANLTVPLLLRRLIDQGVTPQDFDAIINVTLLLLGVALVGGVSNFLYAFWAQSVSQSVAYDLRNAVFDKLQRLSFSYYDQQQTGQLVTRATSDVENARLFVGEGLLQIIAALLTLVGTVSIMFVTSWRLALAALALMPVITLIFTIFIRMIAPRFGVVQRKLGNLNTVLQENIAGAEVVRVFAAEESQGSTYRAKNEDLFETNLEVVRLISFGFPLTFFLGNLATVIVIWYGGSLVIGGTISLGLLIAFNSYVAFLLQPIVQLGFASQQAARSAASSARIFEILDTSSLIESEENAPDLPPLEGHVVLENVHFRYLDGDTEADGEAEVDGEREVLRGVSVEVQPCQKVALLGATGSGKSTLINLIPRFYDPTSGSVRMDGYDLREVNVESLRRQVGVVLQDVNLLRGTIRENIAFGKPDASDEAVIQAAKTAQAHDFITAQPNGYDTQLGERGAGLSGGQRQRVAIARALLIKPPVLIFDDSTSSVDAETEYQIQQALRTLSYGCTSFVIAQRISSVREADLILVLDAGEVVARGTHEALSRRSRVYNEILASQLEPDPVSA